MSLGDTEQAIYFLMRSFEERSTLALFAPIDPVLKPLRMDPRYHQIIGSLHLSFAPRPLIARS
jgi:hypothetical protein